MSVDFFALVPFYVSLVLEELEDYQIIGKAGKIVRLMRVMRILRVYKLFRHFAGLQSLIYTLNQAYKELGLLLHIISGCHPHHGPCIVTILPAVVGILSFASLVYICETELGRDMPRLYRNRTVSVRVNTTWTFPECFWWGLMTITTVGYDINPNVSRMSLSLDTMKTRPCRRSWARCSADCAR